MKRVLLFSCALVLALTLVPEQQTADATVIPDVALAASTCDDKPTNYKRCAAVCDELAECKKCCARGEFPDEFDKKCKDRCTSTFTMTVSVGDTLGADTSGTGMSPAEGPIFGDEHPA